MIRTKQVRTRRSGYRGSFNEQDHPPTPYDPAKSIHDSAKCALILIELHAARWPEHGQNWRVTEAAEALRLLVEWLDRRQVNPPLGVDIN
jgi:hypothetical protein